MPVYLQALRGKTALQTGLILLPLALTGGVSAIIAGRLYDKIGPRMLLGFGYLVLIVNTWQLSQLKGDTSQTWIMLLLALRGLALGFTVQTTFVTALSVVLNLVVSSAAGYAFAKTRFPGRSGWRSWRRF